MNRVYSHTEYIQSSSSPTTILSHGMQRSNGTFFCIMILDNLVGVKVECIGIRVFVKSLKEGQNHGFNYFLRKPCIKSSLVRCVLELI